MAASATLALKAGVWFRRGRLLIVSPDSLGTACPLSGRNSTYRPVQISETSSEIVKREGAALAESACDGDEPAIEADSNLLGIAIAQAIIDAYRATRRRH